MKKLYEKSEIWFAVAWIIAYCFFLSLGDSISASVGMINVATLPIALLLSLVLYFFLKRNGLLESYGLCKSKVPASKLMFYIPVIVMLTANLWYGLGV